MNRNTRAPGFTLIELLVVMVILGLLAAIVGPQVIKYLGDSKTKAATLQIEEYSAALDMYRLQVGHYPDTREGLQALIEPPPGSVNWQGPYLRKQVIRRDPWNREYHYRAPGTEADFEIWSFGADGVEDGEGENRDVLSWR